MGSCFSGFGCKAKNATEAIEICRTKIEESRYEDGHSYSGEIGMANGVYMTNHTFTAKEDAWSWLEDNAEKWGPALGVSLQNTGDDTTTYIFGAWCSS